jgi:Uma2 family endonuclease
METNAMATDLEAEATAPPEEDGLDFAVNTGGSAVLHEVSWKLYRKLRKMPENRHIRMTYDRGELEIMSPSRIHESIALLLGSLIDVWAIELDVAVAGCRTMTIRRADLKRGFEPDNCYYVQHEPQMRDEKKIDFKTDPPPDLAIEVEITRKLLNKMQIYAAFRVPELWCWGGNRLTVLELAKEGEYLPRDTSLCFPKLPIAKIEEIVLRLGTVSRTTLLRSFRDWVRANSQPGG